MADSEGNKFAVDWVAKNGGAVKRTFKFKTSAEAKAHIGRMREQNSGQGYVAKARKL